MCPFAHPFFPSILFQSGCQCISVNKKIVRLKFHRLEVFHRNETTLMTGTFGLNRVDNCVNTSPTKFWWLRIFRIFIMRTMAAWMSNFRSSSMCLWVASCSIFCSVFNGILMLIRSFLLQKIKIKLKIKFHSLILE